MTYPRFDLDLLEQEAASLQATVGGFDADALAAPSGCAGWSRGHVVSHLARHAEAVAAVLAEVADLPADAFTAGEVVRGLRPVYADNAERDRGIEAHASDRADDLTRALAAAQAALHKRLRDLPDNLLGCRVERTPGTTSVPLGLLAFQRLREVVVHHVDLLSGFGFADLEPQTSHLLLADTLDRIATAEPALAPHLRGEDPGTVTVEFGGVQIAGTRAGLLAWLLRQQPDGVTASGGTLPAVPAV